MIYKDYLKTEHWQKKRKQVFERLKKRNRVKCYICKSRCSLLDIHHRSYRRIGKERVSDLILLCRDCHFGLHNWKPEGKILFYNKPNKYRRFLNVTLLKKIKL